jgi:hypothetical protein
MTEVDYKEWELVIDTIECMLLKYGKNYADVDGDYLLVQDYFGDTMLNLIMLKVPLTTEMVDDIQETLSQFQPDWEICVAYKSTELQWNDYEMISITSQTWLPVYRKN